MYVFKPSQINNQAVETVGEDMVLDQSGERRMEAGGHLNTEKGVMIGATIGDASREPFTPMKVAGASSISTSDPDLGVLMISYYLIDVIQISYMQFIHH